MTCVSGIGKWTPEDDFEFFTQKIFKLVLPDPALYAST